MSNSSAHSCYGCIFCVREPNEFETWCSETIRLIDDGLGEENSIICSKYIQRVNIFMCISTPSEPLPF